MLSPTVVSCGRDDNWGQAAAWGRQTRPGCACCAAERLPAITSPEANLELKRLPRTGRTRCSTTAHPPRVFLGVPPVVLAWREVVNPPSLFLDCENEEGLAFKPEGVL